MTKGIVTGAAVAVLAVCTVLALPEVSAEAVEALKTTTGIPQVSGFVFIDGKYVPPPYTVTRRGNGIFINRIQVLQPVPWAVSETATRDEPRMILDADGDFEVVEEEEAQENETADDMDDFLFGGAGNSAGGGNREVHAIDALFDDTPPPTRPTREPQRRPPPPPTDTAMTQQQVDELRARLDTLRKNYEIALGRGDIYFFSDGRARVNGTYGTARTLFSVLPAALRTSRTPQELHARLNQGGVFFIDLATCTDLHKNRMSFMQLEERWKQIEADEAAKRTAPGAGRTR